MKNVVTDYIIVLALNVYQKRCYGVSLVHFGESESRSIIFRHTSLVISHVMSDLP